MLRSASRQTRETQERLLAANELTGTSHQNRPAGSTTLPQNAAYFRNNQTMIEATTLTIIIVVIGK